MWDRNASIKHSWRMEELSTWRWSPIFAAVWPTLEIRESNLAKLSNNPSTPFSSWKGNKNKCKKKQITCSLLRRLLLSIIFFTSYLVVSKLLTIGTERWRKRKKNRKERDLIEKITEWWRYNKIDKERERKHRRKREMIMKMRDKKEKSKT